MWLYSRLIKNELPQKGDYKRLNGAMIIAPFSLFLNGARSLRDSYAVYVQWRSLCFTIRKL